MRHINTSQYLAVVISLPSGKEISYEIPKSALKELEIYLKELSKTQIAPWEEAQDWEGLAKDRIEKYKKAGLAIRGARFREGMSQIALAKASGVHQNEISKIENGKRGVGEKVAKKLAKALRIDYSILLTS